MSPVTQVPAATRPQGARNPQRVVVFSTPTCPWCDRAKAYLRQQRIPFREVDVSRDRAAARDLVRRTGQMGVPVVEIGGKPVIGFDRVKIDRLLGIGH